MRRDKRGYTLIEITVATTILVIVLAIITSAVVFAFRINAQSQAMRETQQNMRQGLEAMFRQIRLASGFYDNDVLDPTPPDLECKFARGFNPATNPRDELIIKTFRGEIYRYAIESGALVERNYGRCGAFNPDNPIVTRLTSKDVTVCELNFIRDSKYQNTSQPSYTVYPPSYLTVQMNVRSGVDCATSPSTFGQAQLSIEESVSLRGEFSNIL